MNEYLMALKPKKIRRARPAFGKLRKKTAKQKALKKIDVASY